MPIETFTEFKDNLVALHFKYDQARRRFVEWAQNEIAVVPDFHKRILFSDEAHFWLNGYVNKQNCRIWSEANPQVYVVTPLHPEKLTVWCALWAGGIIGPYFFKNDEGHNVTVNGDRYRAMITNFFIPELNNHDVQELWFQQDGATCHTARATIDLLKDTFGDRLISRFGPVNWPPRSCDLTPLDYFLWGFVKSYLHPIAKYTHTPIELRVFHCFSEHGSTKGGKKSRDQEARFRKEELAAQESRNSKPHVKCQSGKNCSASRLGQRSKEKAPVSRLVGRNHNNLQQKKERSNVGPEVSQTEPDGYFPVPSTVSELWCVCRLTEGSCLICCQLDICQSGRLVIEF
ncbi:hypothetical protein TNCV_3142711 [Trichonephila clavipes]|nr:hypothetical protein TNCV_3142711 [Trichonephila clavipes]